MKIVLGVLFLNLFLNASFNDDINIYKAMNAYKNKEYQKAYESFEKIENKSDKIIYNMANSLYKEKKYKKALELYEKIEDKNIFHKKYHNIANIYVAMENYEKAIEFYKKALEYLDDERTKFNLSLSENIYEEIKLEKLKRENITNKIVG